MTPTASTDVFLIITWNISQDRSYDKPQDKSHNFLKNCNYAFSFEHNAIKKPVKRKFFGNYTNAWKFNSLILNKQ